VDAGTVVVRPMWRLLRLFEFEPGIGLLSEEVHVRGATFLLCIPSSWNEWNFKPFVCEGSIGRRNVLPPAGKGSLLLFSDVFALESTAKEVPACGA